MEDFPPTDCIGMDLFHSEYFGAPSTLSIPKILESLLTVYGDFKEKGDNSAYYKDYSNLLLIQYLFENMNLGLQKKMPNDVADDSESITKDLASVTSFVQNLEETNQEMQFQNRSLTQQLEQSNRSVLLLQQSNRKYTY